MIQYVHRNKQVSKGFQKTFAFKVPDADKVFRALSEKIKGKEVLLDIEFGMATVNPKDNYCKKEGRKYSSERLKELQFLISNISFSGVNNVDLILVEKNQNMALKVGLKPEKHTARVLDIQLATDATEF